MNGEFVEEKFFSPLGAMTIRAQNGFITNIYFDNQRHLPPAAASAQKSSGDARYDKSARAVQSAKKWLEEYFSGQRPEFFPPLSFFGSSPFRQKVWKRLMLIPYGKTITYGELAKEIFSGSGKKPSAQAVGGAVGHNPVAVIVPCHRVVGCGGALTGYGGGLDRKTALLRMENARFTEKRSGRPI